MDMTTIGCPDAPARLVRGRANWLWQVRRCPCCGNKHQHGGGYLTGDPRALLGHRVAHCAGRSPAVLARGYELVEHVERGVA